MKTIEVGDLIFVRGKGFVSRAIEDITHSAYSHVALAVSADQLIEAQGHELVEYVPTSKYAGRADVYRANLALEARQAIVAHASDHLGEHYGYGLIGVELLREETGIQLPYSARDHPICSVLISDAVRAVGLPICQGVRYPAPGDLARDGLYKYLFALR